MRVIETSNADVDRKFSQGVREVRALTCEVPPKADLDYHGVRLTCEDPRLSLNASGIKYLAVDLKGTEVETMEDGEMEDLLYSMSACLDVEAFKPDGPSQTRMRYEVMEHPAFLRSRRLMAQICG